MNLQWMTYNDLFLDGRFVRYQRAAITRTPALDTLHAQLTAEGWKRRDPKPTAYAVRYTDLTDPTRQSYEVGGLVAYVHEQDGCTLYVSLVSTTKGPQATVEEAIALSTVRVAGVRWPEAKTLPLGKGMKERQQEAARTMMERYGARLDDDAWVQVPYWTRARRGGSVTRIAVRDFKAGTLRNPPPVHSRIPYCRLSGMFLSNRGDWMVGKATVRADKSPHKVVIGIHALDVVRTASMVELRNPTLDLAVWRFPTSEFARLEAKLRNG